MLRVRSSRSAAVDCTAAPRWDPQPEFHVAPSIIGYFQYCWWLVFVVRVRVVWEFSIIYKNKPFLVTETNAEIVGSTNVLLGTAYTHWAAAQHMWVIRTIAYGLVVVYPYIVFGIPINLGAFSFFFCHWIHNHFRVHRVLIWGIDQ